MFVVKSLHLYYTGKDGRYNPPWSPDAKEAQRFRDRDEAALLASCVCGTVEPIKEPAGVQ